MKRGYKNFLGLVAAVGFSVIGATKAQAGFTTINPAWKGEANQNEILANTFGGTFTNNGLNLTNGKVTAVRLDDSKDQMFHFDIRSIQTIGKFSGYNQGLAMSANGKETNLFSVTGEDFAATGGTGKLDMPKSYTFERTGKGGTWSSEQAENTDGADHLVTYMITGKGIKSPTYVLFWEDGTMGKGDFDFNDLAVEVKAAGCPAAVPLPPAAWSGLATLAGGVLVTGYRKARRQTA